MKTRLLAALLCCSLLTGCGVSAPVSDSQPEPSVRMGDIAYVPLDDRPDNAERVEYLANSLGYRLVMPEEDWYKTCLDSQPVNANGTQYGDRGALYQWVLEQEAAGCDRYILSLDQLLSGGLVNSRHMAADQPVALAGGRVMTEPELLSSLLAALAADENNRVWLLDTVMRLAPTCGYDGFGIDEYNHLRAYGMEPRPALTGDGLTAESVAADYRLSAHGTPLDPADYDLTDQVVSGYLAARQRKLLLSHQTQQLLSQPGYERFRLLAGIDDSSAEDSIQKNEIALLRQNLRMDAQGNQLDWVLSGVDDLAFKAVTRLYQEEINWGHPPVSAQVIYYGGTEDRPACDYDSQPLKDIVAEHLDFFGLGAPRQDIPHGWNTLWVLVLTQPADESQKETYMQALLDQLKENTAQDRPTILMDASNNTYGTAFHDALVKQCSLGFLLSYSGFLDMAIVTGTALSHGVARYAWLAHGGGAGGEDLANLSFEKSLAESILLDFCYRNTVREDLSAYVRELGGDPNNFFAPAIDTEALREKLEKDMAKSTRDVLKNLSRSNLLVSLDQRDQEAGTHLAGWGTLSLSNWSFPWQRVFEVRMDILAGPLVKPNSSIFERIFALFSSK